MTTPILDIQAVSRHFTLKRGWLKKEKLTLKAVDDISLQVYPSEVLAVVGESGCGKSTLANVIVGLDQPTDGTVLLLGQSFHELPYAQKLAARKNIQMVFQDPYSSLNPRMKIRELLEEPLIIHKLGNAAQRLTRIDELLQQVGLSASHAERYPHQLSGGQRQRIGIARALAVEPKLIICDEPVSSLDVSVQAQIINLLLELQRSLGISYLFIAHNLAVVKHIADRVAVMYLGRVVELADKEELFANPRHPYTQMLLSSVPRSHPQDDPIQLKAESDLPSPLNIPKGCRFQTRCPYVREYCHEADPQLDATAYGEHGTACHFWQDIAADATQQTRMFRPRPKKDYILDVLAAYNNPTTTASHDSDNL